MLSQFNPVKLLWGPKETFYRLLFMVIAGVLLFLMPVLSLDYGITWDEWNDSNIGMFALRFLLSGGHDQIFLKFQHGYLYASLFHGVAGIVYGFLFDNVTHFSRAGFYEIKNFIPYFTTSHILNSLTGFIAMLYTGLVARKVKSWRAGVLAFVFIILSPRFFGSSMNDPKDIPYAAANIFSLYYMISFFQSWPKPKVSTMVLLAVGIGSAIGVRVGALMLIAYLFLFAIFVWAASLREKTNAVNLIRLVFYCFLISVAGYFLGLIFWPYGQLNPILNPIQALYKFSNFSTFWDGYVLFEGKRILAKQLPWHFIPKWISISSPLHVLSGVLFFISFIYPIVKRINYRWLAMVVFAAIFPIAYVILQKAVLYDSGRHLFFVYPSLVVLAALGWDYLFDSLRKKSLQIVACVVLSASVLEPLSWMIRNHPNEYVYFNPLVGGIDGAFSYYDTDYWGNCMRPASEWLGEYIQKNDPDRPVQIRSDSHAMCSFPFLKKILGVRYFVYGYPLLYPLSNPLFQYYHDRHMGGPKNWDYAIVFSREWEPEVLRSNAWPPAGTIHEIKADHTTLCAVVKNPDKKS